MHKEGLILSELERIGRLQRLGPSVYRHSAPHIQVRAISSLDEAERPAASANKVFSNAVLLERPHPTWLKVEVQPVGCSYNSETAQILISEEEHLRLQIEIHLQSKDSARPPPQFDQLRDVLRTELIIEGEGEGTQILTVPGPVVTRHTTNDLLQLTTSTGGDIFTLIGGTDVQFRFLVWLGETVVLAAEFAGRIPIVEDSLLWSLAAELRAGRATILKNSKFTLVIGHADRVWKQWKHTWRSLEQFWRSLVCACTFNVSVCTCIYRSG